jgi:apolipoprotein N-acyltransferase
MKTSNFYTWLILTSLASLLMSLLFTRTSESSSIQTVSSLLIFFFVVFTMSMYQFSKQAIRSDNPYMFTRVFLVSVMFKILGLALLVLACIKLLSIKPKEMMGPLLSSYLLFTILEYFICVNY